MKVIEHDPADRSIVIVLNDKEQDGTDISWIYDTYFEKLMSKNTKKIVTAGTRGTDMALRLYYGGYQGVLETKETIEEALQEIGNDHDKLYVIATYTALLPSRNAIKKEMGL